MDVYILELSIRLERAVDEVFKIQRALNAHFDGKPFNESFDNELYQEKKIVFDDCIAESLQTVQKTLDTCLIALNHIRNGRVEEFHEAVDALYLESREDEAKKVLSYVKNIIIHLWKWEYGGYAHTHKKLSKEIRNFRNEIEDLTSWSLKQNRNIIKLVREGWNSKYYHAVKEFQQALDDHPRDYTISSTKSFPKECPWTFEQLVECPIEDLLEIWKEAIH